MIIHTQPEAGTVCSAFRAYETTSGATAPGRDTPVGTEVIA